MGFLMRNRAILSQRYSWRHNYGTDIFRNREEEPKIWMSRVYFPFRLEFWSFQASRFRPFCNRPCRSDGCKGGIHLCKTTVYLRISVRGTHLTKNHSAAQKPCLQPRTYFCTAPPVRCRGLLTPRSLIAAYFRTVRTNDSHSGPLPEWLWPPRLWGRSITTPRKREQNLTGVFLLLS